MKIVDWVKKNKIDIILVLALFLIAFSIRMIPSDKFTDIYGFDSFWSARMTKYMITGEKGNWPVSVMNDTTTDYPWGRINSEGAQAGWWYPQMIVYKMFGGTSNFDYELFAKVASWLTAIFGAMAIPGIYLFGKEAYSRLTGLASAGFLLGSSNHIFYSIFGHAENDALGLTLFFFCLYTFILAIKRRNWVYALITAILFSWLSITWQSYNVVVALFSGTIVIYYIISTVLKQFNYYKETEEKKQTRRWMIITLFATVPSGIVGYIFGGVENGAVGFTLLLSSAIFAMIMEYFFFRERKESENKNLLKSLLKEIKQIKVILIIILLMLVVGVPIFGGTILVETGKFLSLGQIKDTTMLPYEQRMTETIAEGNPVAGGNFFGRISTLYSSFGISIWLAVAAVVLIVGKLFTIPFNEKDFRQEWDILAFALVLMSLWVLTSKSITMFFLAGSIAFGAGYFFGFMEKMINYLFLKKEKIRKTAIFVMFIFLIGTFFTSTTIGIEQANALGYDVPGEWFQTFDFLNTIPKGSVITAWWDYGHWMAYFNGDNIKVSLDNIQDRKDVIYTVASAFTHTTECTVDSESYTFACDSSPEALEKAELEALSLLKPLGTTHILVDKEIVGGGTGGKFGALQHIADERNGCIMTFGCSVDTVGNVLCPIGQNVINGETVTMGYYFSEIGWEMISNQSWPGSSLDAPVVNLDNGDVLGTVTSRYYGKNQDFGQKILYSSAIACGNDFFQGGANPTSPVIYAFQNRLFFNDPNLKHVKKVYDDGWNVIYEVDFTDVPEPETYTTWTQSHSVLCTGKAEARCELGYAV